MSLLKRRRLKLRGSKPTANPSKHAIGSLPGGRQSSSAQQPQQPMPSIPHSNSHDLPPNSRKMIVLQEYSPQDNRGLLVKRGESVQVISQDGNWLFVRNEWGKEGHVPSSHLVAPYSSMRSRSKSTSGGHGIRQIASGSSIVSSDMDSSVSSRGGVPMQVSQSAGRPRNHDDPKSRRVVSPPSLSQNDIIVTSMSQGTVPYEQKYSPSSSSGVASMNGPLSPSYQSLQHSNSQENVDPHSSAGSSITQDQSSLSSMEEQVLSMEAPPTMSNGHTSSIERIRTGRAQSESHLTRMKTRPYHNGKKGGVNATKLSVHNYSEIATSETPPPVPPRVGHTSFTSSQGEYSVLDERGDPYADPVDAVPQQLSFTRNSNSLRRSSDNRIKEVRMAKEDGGYSEVYPGGSRSRGINGHHRFHHSQETESEGGSSQRSSKKSSSTCKSYQSRGQQEMHSDPRDMRFSYPDDEERDRDIDLLPPTARQNPHTKIDKFRKFVWGVYIVTQEFESLDENEVSVHPGDHVSVFNQDDRDWFWVVKHSTAEEGFVPSCILEETSVPENHNSQVIDVIPPLSDNPPPLPPKQPLHPTHGQSLYDHTHHFRQRAGSHDTRPAGIVRRGSPASGHRVRGRLNSDGSTPSSLRSSNKAPSVTSIEKVEPRESPPPPYSEFDSHLPPPPPRHFSHSQQTEPTPPVYNAHSMHRTRSHGQVHYRRQGVVPPLIGIERTGSERLVSPDVFQLRSPTTVTGGTLV